MLVGTDVVFGLPGVHTLAIWRALANSPIRVVGVRHEQAAAYAADGYARTTGRLGVCVVTTGPGAANTLAAIGEARASGSPVLVIATDIQRGLRKEGVYRGVMHETRDQAAMFDQVVKAATTTAVANDIGADVMAAAQLACEAPWAPVYLGIPTDLLSAPVDTGLPQRSARLSAVPSDSELATARSLLSEADNPLIWAGGGALRAGAGDAVAELAERIAAPVVTTYMGRGVLPPTHPCYVLGSPLMPEVGRLCDEADLVVAIGTDFDGTMTQNWRMPRPRRLLAINIDEQDASKNYQTDLTLVGDARAVTSLLVEYAPRRNSLPFLRHKLQRLNDAVREAVADDDAAAAQFLDVMAVEMPKDVTMMLDMCIAGYWLVSFYPVQGPRRLHYPVGWGTLGFGFPAAIGAAVGTKGRTVCVTGDGGFLYGCGELSTIAEENLPVTLVLIDDGGYGMIRFDQVHAGEEPFGVDWRSPDFVALARSFGVQAHAVTGFGDEFRQSLRDSLRSPGPNVLVARAALRPPPTTYPRWFRPSEAAVEPSADPQHA